MNKQILLGCIIMGLGVFIIWLPDDDQRLFSFSAEHGPSLVDFIGILILLLGYFLIIGRAWVHREKLTAYFATKSFKLALFMSGLGAGMLIASVAGDFRQWWMIGSAILALIQVAAVYIIIKDSKTVRESSEKG